MKPQTLQAIGLISTLIATTALLWARSHNLPALYWIAALGYTVSALVTAVALHQRKHHPPTT